MGGRSLDWLADQYSNTTSKNFTFSGTPATSGVIDPAPVSVYQSCRNNEPVYTFPASLVPNGEYGVRLHFNDGAGSVGQRKMNVSIEGQQVLTNLDIVANAGGANKAWATVFKVAVNDGNGMTIALSKGSGNDAFISGIEVFDASAGQVVPVTVLSPVGGEKFSPGDIVDIQYKCDLTLVEGVLIKVSTDNGKAWELISPPEGSVPAANEGSQTGSFAWTISVDFQSSATCLIRVEDYNFGAELNDVSKLFSIGESSNIRSRIAATNLHGGLNIATFAQRDIAVNIPGNGAYTIRLFTVGGTQVSQLSGWGPVVCHIDGRTLPTGMYLIDLATGVHRIRQRVSIAR